MEGKICIKQINLHHCEGATSLICNHLQEAQTKKQNLIILIQEPWVHGHEIKGFDANKFDLFYMERSNTKPRTCVITTKSIQATMLPQYCSGDITTILLNIKYGNANEELLLSSVYMPYEERTNTPDAKARDVTEYAVANGLPIVIGADCNAHHAV